MQPPPQPPPQPVGEVISPGGAEVGRRQLQEWEEARMSGEKKILKNLYLAGNPEDSVKENSIIFKCIC